MPPTPSTVPARSPRRLLVLVGALVLAVLSCGREPTAPGGAGVADDGSQNECKNRAFGRKGLSGI